MDISGTVAVPRQTHAFTVDRELCADRLAGWLAGEAAFPFHLSPPRPFLDLCCSASRWILRNSPKKDIALCFRLNIDDAIHRRRRHQGDNLTLHRQFFTRGTSSLYAI